MEKLIFDVLSPLFEGRVYPDVAPMDTALPYCVYRQIGGRTVTFLDGNRADKRRVRVEIVVASKSRQQTSEYAHKVEGLMLSNPIYADADSGIDATWDWQTGTRKSSQDFSFWYDISEELADFYQHF